jgi:hypothetical protein
MTEVERRGCYFSLILLTVVFGWQGVLALFDRPSNDPTRPEIARTAIAPVIGLALFFSCAVSGRKPSFVRGWGRVAAVGWTWACLTFLLHVAVAFHLGHDWSHANAYDHVEQQSGFGPGIFVSYLFTLIWVADVIWLWASYRSYRRRSKWIAWSIAGFLGFVTFNATVVFGSSVVRGWALFYIGVGAVGFLVDRFISRRRRNTAASDATNGPAPPTLHAPPPRSV